ncbi:MAG: dephospho-CoA kinase [Gammaproteobacteria bacterium]|nr:dephospho-CoA kinase [Gammaproteobacteria bacterium]
MLRVGLTGGIGSGKSTVSSLFKLKGIQVVDADAIARSIVEPGQPAYQEIVSHFGAEILREDGQLDRQALRQRVFSDSAQLKKLNQMTHPRVREEMLRQVASAKSDYVILDIPLLIENNLQELVDRVLVVDLPEAVQLARVSARDQTSQEQVKQIILAQIPREQRLQAADDIIDNSGSLDALKKRVEDLHIMYRSLSENT